MYRMIDFLCFLPKGGIFNPRRAWARGVITIICTLNSHLMTFWQLIIDQSSHLGISGMQSTIESFRSAFVTVNLKREMTNFTLHVNIQPSGKLVIDGHV